MFDDFGIPAEPFESNQSPGVGIIPTPFNSPSNNIAKNNTFLSSPAYDMRFNDSPYYQDIDGESSFFPLQSPMKEKENSVPILPSPNLIPTKQRTEAYKPLVVKKPKRSPIILKPFASFDSLEISVKSLNQLSLKEQVPLAATFP